MFYKKLTLYTMFVVLFIILVGLDQVSKYWAEHFLVHRTVHVLGDFFTLTFVKNTGIAFSLPIEGLFLQIVTVLLIGAISVYYFYYEQLKYKISIQLAYLLILSGAVSNAFDRILIGSVTDFIGVKYFAIFNFADIFISIGACLLFVIHYLYERNIRN